MNGSQTRTAAETAGKKANCKKGTSVLAGRKERVFMTTKPKRPDGLQLLPKEDWTFSAVSSGDELYLIVGTSMIKGYRWFDKVPFSAFSEKLTRIDDLERVVVDMIDGGSV